MSLSLNSLHPQRSFAKICVVHQVKPTLESLLLPIMVRFPLILESKQLYTESLNPRPPDLDFGIFWIDRRSLFRDGRRCYDHTLSFISHQISQAVF